MQKLSLAALQPVRVFFFTGFLQGRSASSGCEEKKKSEMSRFYQSTSLYVFLSLFFFFFLELRWDYDGVKK